MQLSHATLEIAVMGRVIPECTFCVKCFERHEGNTLYSFGLSRELVLGALPHLLELDNQTVSSQRNSAPAEEEEEEKEGDDGAAVDTDSEEDYDISKLIGPFTVGKGT